ncbi:MAG: VWA domain-containing protein [Rhodobacteraceae bacterium]|nr:VWA domain-containing protein [Paracoccaceae bacterium]
MIPSTFHFLRPEWLLALLPAAAIVALAAHRMRGGGAEDWAWLVDAHLLRHLAVRGQARRSMGGWLAALGAGLIAAVLAMAGPAWQKLPVPTYGGAEPVVIVLSLAQSMNGTDLVPSRLTRAGHKLRDVLDRERGGDIGLVIYADRPFVAAPLTSDAAVIREMLPELSTDLMPVLGNRLDLAIAEAQGLLGRAGAAEGRIVVMADDAGLDPRASLAASRAAHAAGYTVGVLGVGTEEGAELRTADGRPITGKYGAAITARLDVAGLRALAEAGGGAFSDVTADGRDIAALLPKASPATSGADEQSDIVTDRWADMGYLLLLIPVLLAPFAFRRGLLFALPLMLLGAGMVPSAARAAEWADLLQTPDQQGQAAFDAGAYAQAAQEFTTPRRKAAALYRAGEYAGAVREYAALPGAQETQADLYNLGNALARAGQLEEALAAYDQALTMTPDDADTHFNRDLVAKLLQEQEQKEQQSKGGGQPQDQQSEGGGQPQDQQSESGGKQQSRPSEGGQQQDQQSQGGGQPQDQQSQGGGKPQEQQSEGGGQQQGQQSEGSQPQDRRSQGGGQERQADRQQGQTPQQGPQPQGSDGHGPSDRQAQQQQGASEPGPQDAASAGAAGEPAQDESDTALKQRMDRALAQAPQPQDRPAGAGAAAGTALDQAAQQQLRAVPDDPTGLLRARIRQHYARLRAGQQG